MSSVDKERSSEARPYQLEEMTPPEAPTQETQGQTAAEPPKGLGIPRFHPLFSEKKEEDPREAAERQARDITRTANDTLTKAKQEAEGLKKQAYEEGYQQGLQEGQQAYRARLEAALDNLGRTVSGLDKAKIDILAGMEEEVLALVLAVLDKVFMQSESFPSSLMSEVVRKSVQRLIDDEYLTVKVSQTDINFIQEMKPELLTEFDELKHLKVQADSNLHPGDCLVESATSKLDATLASRKNRVLESLEEVFRQGDPLDLTKALERKPRPASQPQEDLELEDW